ncbi:MAG: cell division protein SepF [Actinomycetota bacterium]|jgi:cell division inhibitor SepF|nr:cell division protein SepF [Actinomycetota bacterium]
MPGTGKKMLMWLGLADAEEYEDYEPYEDVVAASAPRRAPEVAEPAPQVSPAVRTLPREQGSTINLRPVPTPIRPLAAPAPSAMGQSPGSQGLAAKVHVVAPTEFADAQEIADRFRTGQPVIVNLGNAYRELAHRMIDFCSGVAYALGGSMGKVADKVFLMTPTNVEVSAEEKRRLQERGYR